MLSCWSTDPSLRPTFEAMSRQIGKLLDDKMVYSLLSKWVILMQHSKLNKDFWQKWPQAWSRIKSVGLMITRAQLTASVLVSLGKILNLNCFADQSVSGTCRLWGTLQSKCRRGVPMADRISSQLKQNDYDDFQTGYNNNNNRQQRFDLIQRR